MALEEDEVTPKKRIQQTLARAMKNRRHENGTGRPAPQLRAVDIGAAAMILNRLGRRRREEIYRKSISKKKATPEDLDQYRRETRRRCMKAAILHLALLLTLVAYSFIGAAIFQALEKQPAQTVKVDLLTTKANLMDNIWNATTEDVDKGNWTAMVEQLLADYDRNISSAISHGIDIENKTQHNTTVRTGRYNDWDLWEGLFFVTTVYTTIGYGHLYPITVAGRITTIIYALIGIPLFLIVLADMGSLLGELIKYCMRRCKRRIYRCRRRTGNPDKKRGENPDKLSGGAVFGCLSVVWVIYLFVGAYIYTLWEDWTYLESFYFLFISFSTIGFGDVVPKHPRFFLISNTLIFLGLALVSTGLTIIQQIFRSTINRASDELTAKLGIDTESAKPSEEDLRDSTQLLELNMSADADKIEDGSE